MRALSNTSYFKAATLVAASALVTLAPRTADACGGFFCSQSPVDQTAEHILFTVNADESITAIVQISYSGDKDNFAWIVPVPGVPLNLDANFPQLAFQALDTATQPQYTKNTCFRGGLNFGGPGAQGPVPAPSAGNDVNVIAHEVVGPYETTTLEGTSADAIVQWLQANGYRITDKMIPVIEPYVADGMKFIALRLTPTAGVKDISPFSMTYPGDQPMIPIKLTAIAAQPEMGLVAWVFGNRRFSPDNYVDLKVPDRLIEFNEYGYQNNYLTLVSRLADQVGGEAFVTEYAKPTSAILEQINTQPTPGTPEGVAAREKLIEILQGSPFITRLYARMSAEEMLDDPRFRIATDQSEVSNIHDLTDPNFDPNTCATPVPIDPCTFNYCGRRGVCAPTVDSMAAMMSGTAQATTPSCVCAPDATARPTTTANGQLAIYCEPLAMNFDAPAAGGGTMSPLFAPACEGFDCGTHGTCMPMNGNPTCQCDSGFGATAQTTYDSAGTPKNVVSCVAATSIPALPRLPPPGQQSLSSGGSGDHSAAGFCSVATGRRTEAPFSSLGWIAAAVGAGALRRRRRGTLPA